MTDRAALEAKLRVVPKTWVVGTHGPECAITYAHEHKSLDIDYPALAAAVWALWEKEEACWETGHTHVILMGNGDEVERRLTKTHCPSCVDNAINALRAEVERLTTERDKARENADFLRESVGECHLMISRSTAEFQTERVWEAVELPHRLQKIMRRLTEHAEREGRLREALEKRLVALDARLASQWTRLTVHDVRESVQEERDNIAAALSPPLAAPQEGGAG